MAVYFADDFASPSKQTTVDHLRSSIIYEDPSSIKEFYKDAEIFLKKIHGVFPEGLKDIQRIGVRFISIFELPNYGSFEDVFKKIMDTFFATRIPLTLKPTDCKAVLEHEAGTINIGPVRREENYVKEVFTQWERGVPQFGFGVDVDGYVRNVTIGSSGELAVAFKTVFTLTSATEAEVVRALMRE